MKTPTTDGAVVVAVVVRDDDDEDNDRSSCHPDDIYEHDRSIRPRSFAHSEQYSYTLIVSPSFFYLNYVLTNKV